MARRTRKAAEQSPAALAGQPAGAGPTELRGRNERGAVRPADDRYLEDAELDERDAYLLEVTGPEAQQLVAKRQRLRELLDRLSDEQLGTFMPEGFEGGRVALLDRLAEAATTMPNAAYRGLLEQVTEVLDAAPADDEDPASA